MRQFAPVEIRTISVASLSRSARHRTKRWVSPMLALVMICGAALPGAVLSRQTESRNMRQMDFASHTAILDKFQDCSAGLWFDRQRSVLTGSGLKLVIPRRAIRSVRDQYVTIGIRARFKGFATESLFIPVSPLPAGAASQNSVRLKGNISGVRAALENSWRTTFAKGVPEGPHIPREAVAYFSQPPEYRPFLEAQSATARSTTVTCTFQVRSSSR
jgi:hypothetical protein